MNRMTIGSILLLAGLLPTSALAQPDPLRSRSAAKGSRSKDDERNQALLDAHNKARKDAKLPALSLDPKLTAAALVQAKDMAEHEMMSHEGTDGSVFNKRIERQGYKYKAAAENVAAGQRTVAQVMDSWMDSPHHKENILGKYSQVGFAVAYDTNGIAYWCTDFATPWPKVDTSNAPEDLLGELNKARAEQKLKPLVVNARLMKAADWGAKAMASAGPKPDGQELGESVVKQVKSAGYKFRALAQTSARGFALPVDAAEGWLASPPEKKNILGDFTDVGVGFASSDKGEPNWCLLLAKPLRD